MGKSGAMGMDQKRDSATAMKEMRNQGSAEGAVVGKMEMQ
jgi:hypothetical protein